jgi:tetratricopeptide (TPR) repeat protein
VAALERLKKKRDLLAFGLLAALAAAYVAPHLLPPEPRRDLVEYNLAVIFEKMGRDDEAEAHYRKALEANSRDFLSYLNLGNIASRRGDFKAAIALFEKAAALEPESDGAYANLGSVYISLGDLEGASGFLDKALMINPQNIEGLHNKSILFAIRGRFAEAKELNRQVLDISPGWEPALNLKAKIEKALVQSKNVNK